MMEAGGQVYLICSSEIHDLAGFGVGDLGDGARERVVVKVQLHKGFEADETGGDAAGDVVARQPDLLHVPSLGQEAGLVQAAPDLVVAQVQVFKT